MTVRTYPPSSACSEGTKHTGVGGVFRAPCCSCRSLPENALEKSGLITELEVCFGLMKDLALMLQAPTMGNKVARMTVAPAPLARHFQTHW